MSGGPNAKIIGVEPNTVLPAKAARIYAGEDTVAVKSCAVGAKDGEIEFFVTANGFEYVDPCAERFIS